MKKASRLSYLVAGILGAVSIFSFGGLILYFLAGGLFSGLALLFIGLMNSNMFIFLEVGLPIMVGLWISACYIIPPFIGAIIFTILGFIGASKRGGKKPLMIASLVLSILGLTSSTTIAAVFLIQGSVLGLGALDDEKDQVEKEADLELQQVEDILEQ